METYEYELNGLGLPNDSVRWVEENKICVEQGTKSEIREYLNRFGYTVSFSGMSDDGHPIMIAAKWRTCRECGVEQSEYSGRMYRGDDGKLVCNRCMNSNAGFLTSNPSTPF